MSTDTALIEKREELKRRLIAGEYKTLVDIFLKWFERLLGKITRQSKPLPLWFITMTLCVIGAVITHAVIYLAGDWTTYYLRNGASYGFGTVIGFLINIFNGFLIIVVTIVINQYLNRFFFLWRDSILDRTESLISLKKFKSWITTCCNWRMHLFVAIALVLSSLPFLSVLSNKVSGLNTGGYGILLTNFVYYIITSIMAYQSIMVILLYARLRNYDLKLFVADPGSSELISRLSSEAGFFLFLAALFAALFSFWYYRLGFFAFSLSIVVILSWWLPLIALFILNQTSLSSIIRRAKWKTLNDIQAKVEKLQAEENFEEKETMETINRLMDYHDRVKATRDSTLDFRTYLGLFNSLLLTLLAFILGNLDFVLKLFGIKP